MTQLLGWTLLHFLWQGGLIAAAYAAARALLRRRPPAARYAAGCIALLLLASAPVFTVLTLGARAPATRFLESGAVPGEGVGLPALPGVSAQAVATPISAGWQGLQAWLEACLPWCVGVWLAGVAFLTLRLLAGWRRLRELEHRETTVIDGALAEVLEGLRRRLAIRRPVRLLKSLWVEVPTVFGWWRPVILLPAGCLVRLSPRQLELCLAHELAHIRRLDPWVNLAQVILETVLFYHPAVWWISACVRQDRELCCDDLAIRACGDRLAYAEALTVLEELRAHEPALAMAATGGSLVGRIRHILGLEPAEPLDWRRKVGGALLAAGVVLVLVGTALAMQTGQVYTATARLAPWGSAISAGAAGTPGGMTGAEANTNANNPYLLQHMAEMMVSRGLKGVVVQLKLYEDERWGGSKIVGDRTEDMNAPVIERLRQAIRVRQVPNTALIEVRVSGPDAAQAAAIANRLCESYCDREQGSHALGLEIIRNRKSEREARVQEYEEKLRNLGRKYGISGAATNGIEADDAWQTAKASALEQERIKAAASATAWRTKWDALRQLPAEKLRAAIQTVDPDQPLTQLMIDRNQAEQRLALAMQEYAQDHPENAKLAAQLRTIDRQIGDQVEGIMTAIESQVRIQETTAASLAKAVDEARRTVTRAELPADYVALSRQLQAETRILEELKLRWIQEQVTSAGGSAFAGSGRAELVDPAQPPLRPRLVLHGWAALCVGTGSVSSLSGLGLLAAGRRRSRPPAA